MGILAKIKKRIYRRFLQEAEFSIDGQGTGGRPYVLYLGNGADGMHYKAAFKQRRVEGRELSFGPQSTICMALQEIGDGKAVPVVNGFDSAQAQFTGFWARKKEGGRWLWYSQGQGWQPLSADMPPAHLFLDGDDIGELFLSDTPFVVLQAQWRHSETGEPFRNGYPMYSNSLMAHAFGALEGHTYCNTKAAYDNAVSNGYRYFELDLAFTEDKRLVLCHGWEEKNCKCIGVSYSEEFAHMTYERAMKLKAHGHDIMDARQLYREVLKRPQDVYQVDLHVVHGKALRQRIHALLEDFCYDVKALDRLLIQVMDRKMYRQIDAVYHFKHYQYLAGGKIHMLDHVLDFCLDHNICAVALRSNFATPETIRKIHNAGLYAMCYTVKKDADYAKYLLDMGVNTLCTDYVTEAALEQAKDSIGQKPFFAVCVKGPKQMKEKTQPIGFRNDGFDRVPANPFSKEDGGFAGWHLRLAFDGSKYWYCTDGLYHGNIDFGDGSVVEKYLFVEGERMPQLIVKEGMTAELVAVWEDSGAE